jgi:ABC-type nitrate/sulfonate/bicarbonate transport system substrate-binding protein
MNSPFGRTRRRSFLGGAAALAAGSMAPGFAFAQQPPRLGVVSFPGPSISSHSKVIIKKNGFDQKRGWDLKWEIRPTSDAYYNDFVTGVYESIDFGGLHVFGNLHNRGVPLKVVQATVRWPIPVVARTSSGIKTLADLKGKKVAVGRASFAYAHLTGALSNYKLNLEKDTELSNVDFFQAFPRLRRGDFDAAVLLFEHAIQLTREQPNDFVIVADAGAEFAKSIGVPSIYQFQAVRTEWLDKNPGGIDRVIATYRDAAEFFSSKPQEAVKLLALPVDHQGANLAEGIGTGAYVTGVNGLKTEHLARPVADMRKDLAAELEAYRKLGLIEKIPAASFLF